MQLFQGLFATAILAASVSGSSKLGNQQFRQVAPPSGDETIVQAAPEDHVLGATSAKEDIVLLFVGTYSRDEGWVNGTGKGVHAFKFNTQHGSLMQVGTGAFGFNPTFLTGTTDPNRRVIYAVNEVADNSTLKAGTKTGYVYAISVDSEGSMKALNRVESGGEGAAHVSISPNEDYVTVSNYGGGSVSIFPIRPNGSLGPATDFHQWKNGSNVVKDRQDVAHLHSTTWLGKNSTAAFSADLGNERVVQFSLNATSGKLLTNEAKFIKRPGGTGPRHMAIDPARKFAYVVGEISNTIGVYKLDAAGSLSTQSSQEISTLPANYANKSSSADIHVSEDGKYLYSSNRGHNSIAMFKIGADGKLTLLGHHSTLGETPRNFLIYKNFLLVANQDTNNIVVFSIDSATGLLKFTGNSAACGTPVNLFIPRYRNTA